MSNKKIDPKIKVILEHAKKEAKDFGDLFCKPEHVILSIIVDGDNQCVEAFKLMKLNPDVIYDRLSEYLRQSDLTPRVAAKGKVNYSEDTKKVLKAVDKECENLNDTMIEIPHLMLAILTEDNPTTKFLKELKLNYMGFKKTIKDMREVSNSQTNEDFEDEQDSYKKPVPKKGNTSTKTPVLDNFCRDISKAVERNEIDPVVGRKVEIKRVAQILSRRKKNNPILIGDPGVGKTAVVEGLALMIKEGNAPRPLMNKRIYSLDLAAMVAGTKYRGQFEERMKAVIEECKANPDIILFIDEIHTLVGAGNSAGSMDASNMMKPALARGEMQCIGATTLDEFRENIEKDGALTRRFGQVLVEEPTLPETTIILTNIKDKYERFHKVKYTPEAIEECVKLAARYIMERCMPDKAIDVMDEAGAATNMNQEKPEDIKELEAKLAVVLEDKKLVVKQQRYEDAARLRDEEDKIKAQLGTALNKWADKMEKDITIVGVEQISEVVSMMTGIPLTKMSVQESKKLLVLDKEIIANLIGQDEAVVKIVKAIKRNRVGIKEKNKPVGSFICLGPTGVGKTELAKLLAKNVYGDEEAMVRIDMSEYMEKHTVSRLVGAPPGYVGYEEGGQLTEKVRRKPYCVILLDEIEKAHPDIFNILLQVLDEGHLTDGLGRKVNFKNTLIIMTSNIGVTEAAAFSKGMGFDDSSLTEAENAKELINKAVTKKFKPEFLNRIDELIIFNSLSQENIHRIIEIEIKKLEGRLSEAGLKLAIDKASIEFLGKVGYDSKFGARPLKRAITKHVEDPIAEEILTETIKDGDTVKITMNKEKDGLVIKSK